MYELLKAGITTDLIVGDTAEGGVGVGVRLRTIGKRLPKQLMILACGPTFAEALAEAVIKAEDGRWENLDWRARPWEPRTPAEYSRYGLPVNV